MNIHLELGSAVVAACVVGGIVVAGIKLIVRDEFRKLMPTIELHFDGRYFRKHKEDLCSKT